MSLCSFTLSSQVQNVNILFATFRLLHLWRHVCQMDNQPRQTYSMLLNLLLHFHAQLSAQKNLIHLSAADYCRHVRGGWGQLSELCSPKQHHVLKNKPFLGANLFSHEPSPRDEHAKRNEKGISACVQDPAQRLWNPYTEGAGPKPCSCLFLQRDASGHQVDQGGSPHNLSIERSNGQAGLLDVT